ncbi:hypothetical protein JVU11DRAFT_8657 [Chiua virens]|nr:hypothetical protein JVU11DRAFT_8657 [Chiua virens]
MQLSYLQLIINQWSTVPPVEFVDLTGKTVLVVGANSGIGFEAAKHFARMNPSKLILACRSETKGNAALAEIALDTGSKACELWTVDLADFSSVASFAERFHRECDRLDILVMNAAMAPTKYKETSDGWERTLQVNHLSTALLSLLLLPSLVATGKRFTSMSRLVIVASSVHYWLAVPEETKKSHNPIALLSNPTSPMATRYTESKLLNVFFARALQDRLQSITPLAVNAVCPGFCYSNLRRDMPVTVLGFLMEFFLAWTPEQGSRQLVYAAIGERGQEDCMKGAFISNTSVVEPSDFIISEEGKKMQDNVWRETIEVLTKVAPQLKSIVQEYLV